MKITLDRKELTERLQIVQNAVSRRTTLPILSNYLLETDKKSKCLWITSTDLEMGVRSSVSAVIDDDGSITLPAKKLGEILHEMPTNGSTTDIILELKDNNRVQLLGKKSLFHIAGVPKDDYPALPDFNEKNGVIFPSDVLESVIKKVAFAASADETRYVLNGALFTLSKGSVVIVATDGRRLAVARHEGIKVDGGFQAIIPSKALYELSRIIGHYRDRGDLKTSVLVDISENKAGFRIADTTLFTRLIEGNFPGWEQIVPRQSLIKMRANRDIFMSATRRASVCITDKVGTCRYRFSGGRCQITSKTLGQLEFEEDFEIQSFEGEDGFEVSFNPAYILDFLKNVSGEDFELALNSAINPALMTTADEPGYSYVIMPTRV